MKCWNNFFLMFVSGGRFKKEVIIDGQSYLLLIRDEGGIPEMQVCWSHSLPFFFFCF